MALAFCSAMPAAAQPPRRSTDAPAQGRIRVVVSLVSVLASVSDGTGRPIPDLPREAFEVLEDGVKQKVEIFETETTQPLDLVLLIDSSLSTLQELAFQREAGARFLRQVVRASDRAAVYQVSETVTQLVGFTDRVLDLQAAARSVAPGGGTALYDGIVLAGDALDKRPIGRRRVMVLVTDGGETVSDSTFEDARRAAIRAEAMLYTILIRAVKSESGRNTAGEHAILAITDLTGGVMYRADSPADLGEIFDRIDRELRTQYRLGYYPSPQPPPRSQRRIEVRLAPGALPAAPAAAATESVTPAAQYTLRHRKAYITD
jgi:Ca-activated chloride channel family protein